jgi:hypothetical protein
MLNIVAQMNRVIVYSDASDISFGGYIVGTPVNIVHGMWFGVERGNSSTWNNLQHYGAIVINKHLRGQEDTMVYRQPKCR